MDYPIEFARTQHVPFETGSEFHSLIINAKSTSWDLLLKDANWNSAAGKRYSVAEMRSLWGVIEAQKTILQEKWKSEKQGTKKPA